MPRSRPLFLTKASFKDIAAQIRNRKTDAGTSAALQNELSETLQIEDKGERLMALQALGRKNADDRKNRYDIYNDFGITVFLCASAIAFLGIAAGGLFLAGAAMNTFALLCIGTQVAGVVGGAIQKDRFLRSDLAIQAHNRFDGVINENTQSLQQTITPAELATSSAFDKVMTAFPAMKESFLLASAKGSVLEAIASAQPSVSSDLKRG